MTPLANELEVKIWEQSLNREGAAAHLVEVRRLLERPYKGAQILSPIRGGRKNPSHSTGIPRGRVE